MHITNHIYYAYFSYFLAKIFSYISKFIKVEKLNSTLILIKLSFYILAYVPIFLNCHNIICLLSSNTNVSAGRTRSTERHKRVICWSITHGQHGSRKAQNYSKDPKRSLHLEFRFLSLFHGGIWVVNFLYSQQTDNVIFWYNDNNMKGLL